MSAENSLLIKNGRIIDPAANRDEKGDLLIRDGFIEAVDSELGSAGIPVLEADGKVVVPGLIDLHAHFREPGFEYKEDIETGSRAAARGGFTTVACMPNTDPVMDNPTVVRHVRERAKEVGLVRLLPIGAVTKGQQGEELAEMGLMAREGIVAVSDDGYPVSSALLMRRALQYAGQFELPVIDHCEDPSLAAGGSMNEGTVSTALGLKAQPPEAEELMVARDIAVAKLTGGHFHAAHVSTRGSVELLREAKQKGIRVTAEVTPHHLVLTDEEVRNTNYDANTKMNPPLRTEADVAALIEGLKDGTIDFIATDHAPHDADEKNLEFERAAFGIVGLETAFPILYTELVVKRQQLSLERLIELFTGGPAEAFGLALGTLEPGKPGDVALLDLDAEYTVDPGSFASKAQNTPFAGWIVNCAVAATVYGGKVTWSRDRDN